MELLVQIAVGVVVVVLMILGAVGRSAAPILVAAVIGTAAGWWFGKPAAFYFDECGSGPTRYECGPPIPTGD